MFQKYFDKKRYDLAKAGRFKINTKLSAYFRLQNKIVAEHLIDSEGEVIYEKGTLMTKEKVDHLREMGFFEKGAHKYELKINEKLGVELPKIMMLKEAYPELKANTQYLNLQSELKDIENSLEIARHKYNDEVTKYNTVIESVPSNIVASIFAFKQT